MSEQSRKRKTPTTSICTHDSSSISIRGKDLCSELIGKVGFTQMMFLDIFGRMPSDTEVAVLDAVMVTLMEHGLTPSAIASRLAYSSSPEALQGAVAAGLQCAGSVMLGTLGTCAKLSRRIVEDGADIASAARKEVAWHRENGISIPGFGHPHHKPDDPRTIRLFALADELGLEGRYIAACRELSVAVDEAYGKHLTMNASTAMGALLNEIDFPTDLIQGIAIVCRAAGLVAHIAEEMRDPAAWTIARAADEAVPYAPLAAE